MHDYLDGLEWDERRRLATWLRDYFGATVPEGDERNENAVRERLREVRWNSEIGRRSMIRAVARVYDPGCQVDTILIAEGPQGGGKSSAFRALAVRTNGLRPTCRTFAARMRSIMCLGRGSLSWTSSTR